MALPIINSLADCTDFSKTVTPYIPQLYDLPQQFLASITNPAGLKALYISTNPLITALALSIAFSPLFLIAAEVNRNFSQVDRFWSLLPTFYNAHFVLYAYMVGLPTYRLVVLLACSGLWSARLTYNYWRKGGYGIGSEDYRWEILQKYVNTPTWFLFDVVFIAFAQNILLFSVSWPTYVLVLASKFQGQDYSITDLIFSRLFVGFVILAYFADQQQWDFQSAKKEYQTTKTLNPNYRKEDLERGFNVNGLFSKSRHPNFAAEQSVWITLYAWSCFVTQTYYNWAGLGAVMYLLLFQGSTWFTEAVTGKKYPEYKEYQRRVGMFLPWPFSSKPGDFSDKRVSEPAAAAKKDE